MKIGLVGWGVETQSAYRYFGPEHDYLICSEEPRTDFPTPNSKIKLNYIDTARPTGLAGNGSDTSYLRGIENCDVIVYQPSAHKNLEAIYADESHFWKIATTVQHLFFENSPTKHIIGVTGTKGKGTTTTLIAEMLKADGQDVYVGGNIGRSPLDFIGDLNPDSWVVLELSSFQLYKLPYSPHIAVHLMMMPEHIDEWHKTMADYVGAKRNIFLNQNENDIAVYYHENEYCSKNVGSSVGMHIPYGSPPGAYVDDRGYITIDDRAVCHSSEVGLLGKHNLQNICAAITAVWQVTHSLEAIRQVVKNFHGLEHRLQKAGVIKGATYYDDSFGTTPDTAIVALDAFAEQKVVIIGGHDKGNDFGNLAKRLSQDDIRHVIFIGTTGKKIFDLAVAEGLDTDKSTIRDDGNSWTMSEIVAEAKNRAQDKDVVLLSTGCASFGLFKDYKDRGNQFIAEVQAAS